MDNKMFLIYLQTYRNLTLFLGNVLREEDGTRKGIVSLQTFPKSTVFYYY